MRHFRTIFGILLVLMASMAWAQANGDRLIMKDGSYQVVTKYEIKGDRVRFFSAERDDWEEIPKNLVDWDATAKWKLQYGAAGNADQQVVATNPNDPGQVEAAKIDAEERAARQAELDRMPYVMPGLRLPDESGVWVLDTYDGQPELAHMTQANGDLNRAYEHSVLHYAVGSRRGARQLIQADGYSAKVELHVAQPVFYVSLDVPRGAAKPGEEPEPMGTPLTVDTHGASSVKDDKGAFSSPDSRYAILTLHVGRNERTAAAETVDEIVRGRADPDVTETTKTILPGRHWMKITPKNSLVIGQYALVEILGPGELNLDVWAFGVNPQAGDNTATVGVVSQPSQ
ncbi:MAG: hypothetical protein WA634_06080 [Silvibacterium sp.]